MRNIRCELAKILSILLSITLFGCARLQIKNSQEALRKVSTPEEIKDSLEIETFIKGLQENIAFLKTQKQAPDRYDFGGETMEREDYVRSLEFILKKMKGREGSSAFIDLVKEYFDFYEVYGKKEWGEAFVTSYYEPIIPGSRRKTKRFNTPIYRNPPDLVTINVDAFAEAFPKFKDLKEAATEKRSRGSVIRGRVIASNDSSFPAKIVPYYSRNEIDVDKKLEGKKLDILWVDPIDAFFLQIQGSGTIRLSKKKEVRVGYASQNGHPYEAIGKYMLDVIPLEKMSMRSIQRHLRSLPQEERDKLMSKNPSYVFFKKIKERAITYLGTPAIPGRTIATDSRFFPKGRIAYLDIEVPVFESKEQVEPSRWESQPRFVIDQDTGGAIRGPHRVDLFWGRGRKAGQHAGAMRQWGKLYYLAPKKALFKEIDEELQSLTEYSER